MHHNSIIPLCSHIISCQSHCNTLIKSQWWPCSSFELVMVYLRKIICDATNYDLYDLKKKNTMQKLLFYLKNRPVFFLSNWMTSNFKSGIYENGSEAYTSVLNIASEQQTKEMQNCTTLVIQEHVKYPVSRFLADYHISLKSLHSKNREKKKAIWWDLYCRFLLSLLNEVATKTTSCFRSLIHATVCQFPYWK